MKKKKILISSFVVGIILSAGCTFKKDQDKSGDDPISYVMDTFKPINYEMNNSYDSKNTNKSSSDILNFSYANFVDSSIDAYSDDLAKLGILLSADMYSWMDLDIKINNVYKKTKLLDFIFAKDVQTIKLDAASYNEDKNDLCTFQLAHYEFEYNEKINQVFFVIYEGTDKNNNEWNSNLDVGANTSEYLTSERQANEWLNKDNHKGLDIAANRSFVKVDEYINEYKNTNFEQIMFITGHSRGGSIANLAGKHYVDLNNSKVFTYTFASCGVVSAETIPQYNSIFNIINSDDIVTQLPPLKLGFKRYGVDKGVSINTVSQSFKDFTGITYKTADLSSVFSTMLTDISTRDDIYKIPEDYNDPKTVKTGYTSEASANTARSSFINNMSKDIAEFVEVGDVYYDSKTSSYAFKYKSAFAVALIILADGIAKNNLITKLNDLSTYFPTLTTSLLSSLTPLMGDTTGIQYPHTPESYIVVVNNL